jgi:hypothetical protein
MTNILSFVWSLAFLYTCFLQEKVVVAAAAAVAEAT